MLQDAPFGRLLTAMVTPFARDGRVDLGAAVRVALHLADNGSDGIVVSGTTGESPRTSADECGELLSAVKDAVGDKVAVVAGVGTASTAHSVELAEQAARIGADGLLLAFLTGGHAEALRLHLKLKPACDAITGVPNYGATTAKAAPAARWRAGQPPCPRSARRA